MSAEMAPYEPRAWEFDLTSPDVENHYQRIMTARRLALSAPLVAGLQFTLPLEIPAQNVDPTSRKLPIIPADLGDSLSTTLQLDTALQRGVNAYSQVWTAHPIGVPETRFVMKIIQPSLCRWPKHEWGEYRDPWDLAHGEAWAYRALARRQGLSIPYFFGLHTITSPSGEAAWVLILEFIPGMTVDEVVDTGIIPDIQEFCILGLEVMGDFGRSGWVLPDIRGANFILTGPPGNRSVVMIDLFQIGDVSSKTEKDPVYAEGVALRHSKNFLRAFFHSVGDEYPGFGDWARSTLSVQL
ncbi:hypothetical protein C8R46DRAFT_1104528 [Mycena filopes]|nr:hypothetical protein C8R46DRAFT_1104528 [Mycena filopes]